ncbi:MAG: molybdate ABC transporter substrate-binding protein [Thermoanaerobaculia bacterium]
MSMHPSPSHSARSFRRAEVFALSLAFLFAPVLHAAEVVIFAAASLTNVLQELAPAYEIQSGDHLVFNFAASSTLERQIEEGAPADIFFSADEARMDSLQRRGDLIVETRRSLLSNNLVIVVAAEGGAKVVAPRDLASKSVKVLALAEPQSVPAGIYAREYLTGLGLWRGVIDKVVPTENVRAALAAVESGNADAAIVYRSDAAVSKKVRVVFEVPTSEGPKISYPVAVLKGSKVGAAARAYVAFLSSEPARDVFRRALFTLPE